MAKYIRGLEQRQEQAPSKFLRDTRTLGQKIESFFSDPFNSAIFLACMGVAAVIVPAIADLVCLIGIAAFTYTFTRKIKLPYRMPQRSGVLDFNDLKPGSGDPHRARGISFFGNELKSHQELWFSNDDMRTHVLIFGSTGSGKTETLISFSYNALVQGSGLIYVDGKGDNTLFSKIFPMARRLGREEDVLVINFMTGARDVIGPQKKRLSNTLNPFAEGSSSMLAQLIVSMMDSSSASPDGDMWKGRAISFVEALMKVLTYARDEEFLLLDANTIRNYFTLERLEAMVMDKVLLRNGEEPASLEKAPDSAMEPISNYLFTLPGYDKAKKGKQVSQVLEQHGFISMQLTRIFVSLADTYGHIVRARLAEVDFHDVVLNRRILVVLLPALEKAPEELSNLGKIIVSSLKAMMAAGLGEDVEGEYRDIVMRKPTNAPTPFLCILDEYGYYAVPGFAVVPAQARSLGFSTIFAGQDLPAFQKASKEEAASIGANTNIKICMKLEDPVDTWEFFSKTAGEAYVTKVDHFQTQSDSMTNNYMDTKSASFEKRARIDLLDLKEQGLGEAHIFFKSTIIRAKTFFVNPPPVKVMRLNQMLMVEKPKSRELIDFNNRLYDFYQLFNRSDFFDQAPPENKEIAFIAHAFEENDHLDPIERGVATLMAFDEQVMPGQLIAHDMGEEETLPDQELNVFARLRTEPAQQAALVVKDMESFSLPLLLRQITHKKTELIERLSGKTEDHAKSIADEIIKDMVTATHYPPENPNLPTQEALLESTKALISGLQAERLREDTSDSKE